MNDNNLSQRTYFDEINDETIYFLSDASQEDINSLSFNGEWHTVKSILIDWGYNVFENQLTN